MTTKFYTEQVTRTGCDLCGKPIITDRAAERGEITFGWVAHKADDSRNRWWTFLWDPSHWTGYSAPGWKEREENPRYKRRKWDFHSECLIATLEPIIEERENGVEE